VAAAYKLPIAADLADEMYASDPELRGAAGELRDSAR
jgi:hypothetical protein